MNHIDLCGACDNHVIDIYCIKSCVSCDINSVQRALGKVTVDQWVNIPDVGDARNKKQRNAHIRPDRYTPIPDSILVQGLGGGGHNSLDPRQQVCTGVAVVSEQLVLIVNSCYNI